MKINYSLIVLFTILITLISCDDKNDSPDPIEYPIAEFLPKLSELKLFEGDLANLEPTSVVDIYKLNTPLFTDYSHKKRFLSLPEGTSMSYDGEGFPIFPINTILTKTFYYNNDERDTDLGKNIIETRVLINTDTGWMLGNYIWNSNQTDADLTIDEHPVPVEYIDINGLTKNISYIVPGLQDCIKCHSNRGTQLPIGPKIRNLNHTHDGVNFLEKMITEGKLIDAPMVSEMANLPTWNSDQNTLEEKARAYLDVNCAHCHQPGGEYNTNFGDNFDLRYEIGFSRSNIDNYKDQIVARLHSLIPQYGMPLIGVTELDQEGYDLIVDYVDSL